MNGRSLYGKDYRTLPITGLNIEIFLDWYHRAGKLNEVFLNRPAWLDKLMGTDMFRKQLKAGMSADHIRASWRDDLNRFKKRRALYLLYPE